jgi:hypothetical protein
MPFIEAIAINKKTTPKTHKPIQNMTPFTCSEFGILGFLSSMRWAMPNNRLKKLTKIENRRIAILGK